MEEYMELKNNEKEIIFKDKYSMSLKENIFVAKRNLIDYIWKSANLEGIAVTYPQTEIISEGMAVNGMRINDINAIVNLKHAWQFTLENINYPLDFKFISQINKIIGDFTELFPKLGKWLILRSLEKNKNYDVVLMKLVHNQGIFVFLQTVAFFLSLILGILFIICNVSQQT